MARSSRGPRRLSASASASALCLGLRVGQRSRALHGPAVLPLVTGGDGASRSVETEPCLLLARARLPVLLFAQLVRRAAALREGAGWIRIGQASLGASTEWEAREYRLGSLPNLERMELIEAVREEDSETVKVRRLLEVVSGTEYGPSRGVCLGLG